MAKKIFVQLALIFSVVCLLHAQTPYDEKLKSLYRNTVPQVKTSEVVEKMDSGQRVILLDTRSPEEYTVSHIPGASLINYDEFRSADVERLDRNAEIIVYCSVGYRSERIGEKLQTMGFKNVKNLYGGIFQWANDGRTLFNKDNLPTDSVHTYNKRWAEWLKRGIKVY